MLVQRRIERGLALDQAIADGTELAGCCARVHPRVGLGELRRYTRLHHRGDMTGGRDVDDLQRLDESRPSFSATSRFE